MNKSKTANKSILKSGYYYEFKPFFDSLPEKVATVAYRESVLTESMKYADILKKFGISPEESFGKAAGIALNCIPTLGNGEYRVIFFTHDEAPCGLHVWRRVDGDLYLYVYRVDLDRGWLAGHGVLSGTQNETGTLGKVSDALSLEPLETLHDLTTVTELLGKWSDEKEHDATYTVTSSDTAFAITVTDRKETLARKLHGWYLEATARLHPESYNPNAQKPYDDMTEEQKFMDRYIAGKIIELHK